MNAATRRSLVIVTVTAVALFLYFALRASPPPARIVDRVEPSVAAEPKASTPQVSSAERVKKPEPIDGATPTVAAEAEPPNEPLASAAPEKQAILGTIVVVDEQGIEHPTESGTLRLVVWRGNDAHADSVEVKEGSWQ